MREHIKELYGRIEQLENQENREDDGGRRRRRKRRDNDGGDAREEKIEGVKLNVPPFQGKSDP